MPHLVLLGDSVFDNGAYTQGQPDVIGQVQGLLPEGWTAQLGAIDGSTTDDIGDQLAQLPGTATHLLLSVGGNDALLRAAVLETPVAMSGEAFLLLGEAVRDFEQHYTAMLAACLAPGLPLTVCTVYHGNFPEPAYQQAVAVALTAFNDVILRAASRHGLTVLDLRSICTMPSDFANPIEPSSQGGAKIAQAAVRAITQPGEHWRGARLLSL